MPATKKTQNSPAKVVKTEAKAERQQIDKGVLYAATGNYNPKAEANVISYTEVCKVLPGTYQEIIKVIPQHTDFVGYLIRRGGIAPVK